MAHNLHSIFTHLPAIRTGSNERALAIHWWICAWRYRRGHCRAWVGAVFRMFRGWLSCTDNSRLRTHQRPQHFDAIYGNGRSTLCGTEQSSNSTLNLRSEWMEAGCQQTNFEILVRTSVISFIFELRLSDDWLTSLCYWAQQFAWFA